MGVTGQLASATGSMGLTTALAVVIQWLLPVYMGVSISGEQAGALSVLLYPFVHLVFLRVAKRIEKEQKELPQ